MSYHKYLSASLAPVANLVQKLREDENGNFAVVFAIAAIPLLLATSAVIDTANVVRVRTDLQAAADDAVLAAVIPATMNDAERQTFAENTFFDNVGTNVKFSLSAESKATRERVDIEAKGTVPSLLGGIIGRGSKTLSVTAAAELTSSDVVCVLALDPEAPNAISFEDSAVFNAPACSVQANSTNSKAILSSSNTAPHAKSFCSAGGSHGTFDPYIKNECTPIDDPYANIEPVYPGKDCDFKKDGDITGTNSADTVLEDVPDNAKLSPSSYCKGLSITGANVTFTPGIYYMGADIHFTQYSQVKGDGVTFVMMGKGKKGRLFIDEGAEVYLRAPKDGVTGGVVFWQVGDSFGQKANLGKGSKAENQPAHARKIETSEISSGASMTIVGTVYLPDQNLIISSDKQVASKSPTTSFITNQIHFKDKANMHVSVDHEKGGVPPLEPRSDGGARLIR